MDRNIKIRSKYLMLENGILTFCLIFFKIMLCVLRIIITDWYVSDTRRGDGYMSFVLNYANQRALKNAD